MIAAIYKTATFLDSFINPQSISLPHPAAYSFARFALWSLYGFWAGLFATGLWVIAHECGHQAFSESKFVNNAVGWVLHSAYVIVIFVIPKKKKSRSPDISFRFLASVFLTTHGASLMLNTMPLLAI